MKQIRMPISKSFKISHPFEEGFYNCIKDDAKNLIECKHLIKLEVQPSQHVSWLIDRSDRIYEIEILQHEQILIARHHFDTFVLHVKNISDLLDLTIESRMGKYEPYGIDFKTSCLKYLFGFSEIASYRDVIYINMFIGPKKRNRLSPTPNIAKERDDLFEFTWPNKNKKYKL